MPRNVSDVYSIPPGTEGVPDTPIESDKYNAFAHDVETDLNMPRPIVAGGTGANTADAALLKLGGEKASQLVANYDTQVFLPGSFYSSTSATGSPVSGHAFAGVVYSADNPVTPNLNLVLHARDLTDTLGRMYIRIKKAGTWQPWSLESIGLSSDAPPVNPPDNTLWWDSEVGQLFIYYNDGSTKQWVIASPVPDPAIYLNKLGDTMFGPLTLVAPTTDLHAATKKYVDDAIAAAIAALP